MTFQGKLRQMPVFHFQAGIAIRAYGTISVTATTIDEAKAEIRNPAFNMQSAFRPGGSGSANFDFNYHRPSVHLFSVTDEPGLHKHEMDEDIPDDTVEDSAYLLFEALLMAYSALCERTDPTKPAQNPIPWAELDKAIEAASGGKCFPQVMADRWIPPKPPFTSEA